MIFQVLTGSETGTAKINVYRAGYIDTDTPEKPFRTFDIKTQYINSDNKNKEHLIRFTSIFGQISLQLDGAADFIIVPPQPAGQTPVQGAPPQFMGRQQGASVNLNPVGSGGNYIPFGMLCEMGFSADPGQKATFSNLDVSNNRFPNNKLFSKRTFQISI